MIFITGREQRCGRMIWVRIAPIMNSQSQRVRRMALHYDSFGRTGTFRKVESSLDPKGVDGSVCKQEALVS